MAKQLRKQRSTTKVAREQKLQLVFIGVMVILTAVFFGDQLAGNSFFWEDFVEQFYPFQHFAARHLASGVLPHWNPYTFSGMPFLADLQNGVFYPPYWIFALSVGEDGRIPVVVLEGVIIAHFLIAQLTMFFLLRSFRFGVWASLLGAVAYGFSTALVFHAFHPMIVAHLAWFPLVFRFFHRALTQREFAAAVKGGLVAGLAFLSGHPQTAFYLWFFLGCYALFWWARQRWQWRVSVAWLLGTIVAAGIFAIQLLPTWTLRQEAERKEISYEFATEGSYAPARLITLLIPNFFGRAIPARNDFPVYRDQYFYYWETTIYVGGAVLLLGLIGLWHYRSEPEMQFFAIFTLFALTFAFGKYFFVHRIFFALPGFQQFRIPARMLLILPFLLSFAAARTFWGLWEDRKKGQQQAEQRTTRVLAAIVLGVLVLVFLGVIPQWLDTPPQYVPVVRQYALVALLLAIAGVLVVELGLRRRMNRHFAGLLLVGLTFWDLYWVGAEFNRSPQNPEQAYALSPAMKAMFRPRSLDSLFRIKMREGGVMAMKRNQGPLDSLMLVEGYNPLLLKRRQPPFARRDDHWRILNVRYELVVDPQTRQAHFVERTDYLPRARMLYRVRFVPDSLQAQFFQSGKAEIETEAVVGEKLPVLLSGRLPQEVEHSIHCRRYEHNRIEYEVQTAEPGLLWLSEIWYPEWKAWVDGQPAKIYRVDYGFRGIVIPEGTHNVVLEYVPTSYRYGSWITGITLLISIGFLILHQRRHFFRTRPS